ncbi:unnamed protein product [Didymodactylos carnosus]|uniref:SRA1/Sec31 domain-containing protein n=1 Tax=Didymodactylos carnosus TaxID=1234261 RepID=A0A813W5C5_9BILA|nr:unnamed protein product [Didymodactylos carnosus]CAF0852623.1 unnamed protein product [Didymodactylos carnosus]CAF3550470.1 unnamed protein product [Didymodactylos carnosus]CAF3640225.1 unnamed protein product [Didymodactylos carnosus]
MNFFSEQISTYLPQGFRPLPRVIESNFFIAPQPKKGADSVLSLTSPVEADSMSMLKTVLTKLSILPKASAVRASSSHAVDHHHVPAYEKINLWRTPYKGDDDTITQVKSRKGALDNYVERRTRRIQELQLHWLRHPEREVYLMFERDKIILSFYALSFILVLFATAKVGYDQMKKKDRLKRIQPPPPPPSTVTSHTNYVKSAEETKTNSIDEITEQFNQQFKKLEDAEIERKILDDITKKFQILVDDWKQNKLTLSTKEKLSELFENLDHNLGLAFDLHVGLVRNSGAEVVRFIVGIKRLIQELQRISTLSENTTNKSNEVSPN